MKKVLLFLLLFCGLSYAADHSDEYITIFTPKFITPREPYQVFFKANFPSEQKTEIAVQITKDKSATLSLVDEKFDKITFVSGDNIKKKINLNITLYRKYPSGVQKCITRSVNVAVKNKFLYIFVQTDKPIYKPGDQVKFRVLVIDKDLNPYHMNNIEVKIIDPNGETLETYSDMSGLDFQLPVVFNETFNLNEVTPLGDWTIKVVVEKKTLFPYSKNFAVQKYVLPIFDLSMQIPNKKLLLKEKLEIKFEAKYPFGEYVYGNAELVVKDLETNITTEPIKFKDVSGPTTKIYSLTDLNIKEERNKEFEAMIKFTEPESGETLNKTVKFYVFGDPRYHINVEHPKVFHPGQPFNILVRLYDWKMDPLPKGIYSDDVSFIFRNEKSSGHKNTKVNVIGAHSSVVQHEIIVSKDSEKLDFEVRFINSKPFRVSVAKGVIDTSLNCLIVDCMNRCEPAGNSILLAITSMEPMNKVIVDVVTHTGSHNAKEHNCSRSTVCTLNQTIEKEMRPYSKIVVYQIKDNKEICKGQTHFKSAYLSENSLDFTIETKTPQPKKDVTMKFKGTSESTIYLLAFDKRLISLRDGNDITRKDVDDKIADFETETSFLIQSMKAVEWNICSEEEIKRVNANRINTTQQSGLDNTQIFEDEQEEDFDLTAHTLDEIQEKEKEQCLTDECITRKDFPETWIFEELRIDNQRGEVEKIFKIPDSMTTWKISAFSLHKEYGLAIAQPKDLTIKIKFFMEINLPYSVRFKETIRIDVLTHFYSENVEYVNATVALFSSIGFSFVNYTKENNICFLSKIDKKLQGRALIIPNRSVKRASFYIQPIENSTDSNIIRNIKMSFFAKGIDSNGSIFYDRIIKYLRVEPFGIREVKVNPFNGELKNGIDSGTQSKGTLSIAEFKQTETRVVSIDVLASRFFLVGDLKTFSQKIPDSPSNLLGATSKLKLNAEKARYSKENYKKNLEKCYQELSALYHSSNEAYKNSVVFHAFFTETLATMEKQKNKSDVNNFKQYFKPKDLILSEDDEISYPIFGSSITAIGELSFALIPFLKHRDIFNEMNYAKINKTVESLIKQLKDQSSDKKPTDLSIAAYVLTLHGDIKLVNNITTDLLQNVVKDDNVKCYKLKTDDSECDIVLTSYIALTYIKRMTKDESIPIISWLLTKYAEGITDTSQYFERAIISEVVAEVVLLFNIKSSNLIFNLENDLKINQEKQSIEFTPETTYNEKRIKMSKNSKNISYNVKGNGIWSLIIFYDLLKISSKFSPNFKVTVQVDNKAKMLNNSTINIVRICGQYKKGTSLSDNSEPDVYYEVVIPSGYIYQRIVEMQNKTKHQNIDKIYTRNGNTRVIVHYNKYEKGQDHCITIEALKTHEIINPQDASVKIYDYFLKDSSAIEFYNFEKTCEVHYDGDFGKDLGNLV